jgi:hypothetical protein
MISPTYLLYDENWRLAMLRHAYPTFRALLTLSRDRVRWDSIAWFLSVIRRYHVEVYGLAPIVVAA